MSFRIEDAESIFGDMLDKHVAPMGLYAGKCFLLQTCRPAGAVLWKMALSTNMPPLRGCMVINASLLQTCHPYGVCKFKVECISDKWNALYGRIAYAPQMIPELSGWNETLQKATPPK